MGKLVKIFIDPGHGGADTGALGEGLQEKVITLQISGRIRNMLLNEYENVSVLMSRTTDRTVSLQERTDAANKWMADFLLSVHVNAAGGTGYEDYVYPNVGTATTRLQSILHEEILKVNGLKDRGKKQANFHMLRESKMPAVLTENGFIDYPSDAAKLKDSAYLERIARGHVNGIVRAFNLKKKSAPVPKKLYKVQIGAFSELENAEEVADQAREAGFDVYVIRE